MRAPGTPDQAVASSPEWTFADVWETIATEVPDRIALVHGDQHHTWRDFDRHAGAIAEALINFGLQPQEKVALYLHNSPAYLESVFAALKVSLVPVNTNYRYTGHELVQLWTNADAAAVVFHGAFAAQADAVRARCPAVRAWLFVDDGEAACPSWAAPTVRRRARLPG